MPDVATREGVALRPRTYVYYNMAQYYFIAYMYGYGTIIYCTYRLHLKVGPKCVGVCPPNRTILGG